MRPTGDNQIGSFGPTHLPPFSDRVSIGKEGKTGRVLERGDESPLPLYSGHLSYSHHPPLHYVYVYVYVVNDVKIDIANRDVNKMY